MLAFPKVLEKPPQMKMLKWAHAVLGVKLDKYAPVQMKIHVLTSMVVA